jgi:hypothetical protein
MNGAKPGKRRMTILIALLFSASQIRAKESLYGGSKPKLRGLYQILFDPEYKELIAAEKKRLSEELYGSGRQES